MKNKKLIIVLITLLTIITIVLVVGMIFLIKSNHNIFGMSFNYKTSNNLILDR